MPKRRHKIKVIIDTNVFIANFLTHSSHSPNRRVIRLWLLERAFKLALSSEIKEGYLKTFDEVLGFDGDKLLRWQQRLNDKRMTESLNPGVGLRTSRDPNDDMFIAAAVATKAKFLTSNDHDLLDINDADKRKLKFQIVTPKQFLEHWENLL